MEALKLRTLGCHLVLVIQKSIVADHPRLLSILILERCHLQGYQTQIRPMLVVESRSQSLIRPLVVVVRSPRTSRHNLRRCILEVLGRSSCLHQSHRKVVIRLKVESYQSQIHHDRPLEVSRRSHLKVVDSSCQWEPDDDLLAGPVYLRGPGSHMAR